MTTHSSVLALRITGTGKPVGLLSMESHRVGHNWSSSSSSKLYIYYFIISYINRYNLLLPYTIIIYWRRPWHPTPVLLPGKSHARRSLVGYSPWSREESDTTEQLPFHFSLSCIGEGNGNPLQCSCLENPRDRGSLVSCRLWGCTESDMTEVTQQQQYYYIYC